MASAVDERAGTDVNDLLSSVAEQLKIPLTVITRQAELGQLAGDPSLVDGAVIRTQAAAALQLVDSYLLGLELVRSQQQLPLEPVSISSLLVDIAHSLEQFAQHYRVQLELSIAGKYQPVMASSRGLRAAFLSLGFALVEAQAAQAHGKPHRLTLAVHRTPQGIITGMYGQYEDLAADQWRRALQLQGRATQPFRALMPGSGAGLFVADTILRSMESGLHVGRHEGLTGLAATLQPSQQLQFV
jgi:hypothetical protein